MSSKRGKLTADKARARITSLEESVESRTHRLEQLRARIARSANPEEKLLNAQERLERRLTLEQEQIQKLRRLLGRREASPVKDSSELYASEEYDELHRSFEEVKQDLTKVKSRLENATMPRDVSGRLTSFEERITRREKVDSDLFSQILEVQTALDQERQTVRRLSRRIREQDQSLDALREAVEDSVVATVDLAERLEELEESFSDSAPNPEGSSKLTELRTQVTKRLEQLDEQSQQLKAQLEQALKMAPPPKSTTDELAPILETIADLRSRLEEVESRPVIQSATTEPQSQVTESGSAAVPQPQPSIASGEVASFQTAPLSEESEQDEEWVPAKFSTSGSGGRLVAQFSSDPIPKLS